MGLLGCYSLNKGHSLQIINVPRMIRQKKGVRLLLVMMWICATVFVVQKNRAVCLELKRKEVALFNKMRGMGGGGVLKTLIACNPFNMSRTWALSIHKSEAASQI